MNKYKSKRLKMSKIIWAPCIFEAGGLQAPKPSNHKLNNKYYIQREWERGGGVDLMLLL